jgi:hypothetical protein
MQPPFFFSVAKRIQFYSKKQGGSYVSEQKVIPMKKRFRPNVAFFIFLLVILYVVVLLWNYLTKEHISIYEVNATEISDDAPLYGLILRSEEVVNADTEGYVNYYNSEGSRIGVGDVVYTIDQNGEVNDMLEKLQTDTSDSESITAVRDAVASFQNAFVPSDYQQVKSFASSIDSVLFEYSRGNLFEQLNKQMKSKGLNDSYVKGTSKKSGILVYSIDGYEDIKKKDITAKTFDQYTSVSKTQLQKETQIAAGDPVYKLITSNDWSLVVNITDSYYEKLTGLDYVRVTIDKDNMSFNAGLELFDQDGSHFAVLKTSRYMEHYINDRFLKLEFSLNTASGLKIPNNSILEKEFYVLPENVVVTQDGEKGVVKQTVTEDGTTDYLFTAFTESINMDGNYYIDSSEISAGDILMNSDDGELYTVSSKQSLQGVYLVNQGYCEFRPVEVIYQNKEYTIVSDSTNGGLSAYDHIVVDPTNLNDDDFIQ